MIEMNHAEVAKQLERLSNDFEEVGTPGNAKILRSAAADEHRIENGELVPAVYGEWICEDHLRQCSNCRIFMGMDRMEIPERFKYCPFCGALMGEARKGDSLNGKDDSHAID